MIRLIASPLTAGIGVTVIDGQPLNTVFVLLHALTVCKFRAVIYSDGLERIPWKLLDNFTQSFYCSRLGFTGNTQYDLITGQTLRKDKERLPLTLCFTYHAVKFPMAEGCAGIYLLWMFFYTAALWRTLCFDMMIGAFCR